MPIRPCRPWPLLSYMTRARADSFMSHSAIACRAAASAGAGTASTAEPASVTIHKRLFLMAHPHWHAIER